MDVKRCGPLVFLLVLAGCGAPKLECVPGGDGVLKTTDEIQYLDFVLPFMGLFEDTGEGAGDPNRIHQLLDDDVASLIAMRWPPPGSPTCSRA